MLEISYERLDSCAFWTCLGEWGGGGGAPEWGAVEMVNGI